MGWIGTAMGRATIPMALLTLASGLAGLVLLLSGWSGLMVRGLAAFVIAYGTAMIVDSIVRRIDEVAYDVRCRRGRVAARPIAAAAGILPMVVLLGWEIACCASAKAGPAPLAPAWLWSYAVATGPWTLFALRVGKDRRTICGIRAYAGHLAYWLLSFGHLVAGLPLAMAAIPMIAPALLPIIVGSLLAVASRDALRDVRV